MKSKVVYILGAGFSAPLGLPVMGDFLNRSKDLHAAHPERFKHFSKVFREIGRIAQAKNYLEIDLFNIEQILSILDMEDYAFGTSHRDDFTKYVADTIIALTPSISTPQAHLLGNWEDRLFAEDHGVRTYCYWLAGLLGISVRETDQTGVFALDTHELKADYGIITLNYDLVLENCLKLINSQVDNAELRFRVKHEENGGKGLPMAKLHGSVEPLTIVPPTWQKLSGTEVRDAWKLAAHLLAEANEVRILGFSFPETDGYIKYLLSLGAMRAPHLKQLDVICLDPTGDVEDRYKRFISFPEFRYRPIDLGHCIDSYRGWSKEPFHGHRAIQFTGIEEHHRRMMGHPDED